MQSEKLFIELVEADPEDMDNQMRLVQVQHNTGALEMDLLRIPAAMVHLRRSLDELLRLDRQGTLDGRPRDREQLLPAFQRELAACEAVGASIGNIDVLKSRSTRQASRLLRIRAGVLVAEGRSGELAATASALVGLDSDNVEDLYELGRSLALCAGYLDQNAGPGRGQQELQTWKQRFGDRSVAVLERTVKHGLRNPQRLKVDVVLAPVRGHPGFRQLEERIAAANPLAKP